MPSRKNRAIDLGVRLLSAAEREAGPVVRTGRAARKAVTAPEASLAVAPRMLRARAIGPVKKPLDLRPEARMERARSMGFDIDNPLYVSMLSGINAFEPHGRFAGRTGLSGISLTDNPRMAARYLDRFGDYDYRGDPFTKNMMQAFIRPGNIRVFDEPLRVGLPTGSPLPTDYAWPSWLDEVDTAVFPDALSNRGGVKHVSPSQRGAILGREYVLRDPSRVRSSFAAFDPDEVESSVLTKARGGAVRKVA